MTLFGYTTYLLFHQIDEENHDEWEEGYLPNYPKIPWHLDGRQNCRAKRTMNRRSVNSFLIKQKEVLKSYANQEYKEVKKIKGMSSFRSYLNLWDYFSSVRVRTSLELSSN
ncbi:unnamed protein product [Wuchereria bancrofti]|uniref:Uncharacterized protein n=1 Tax=Wuchereria bancrofti TaxID=6293 RepID=A0A3P7E670_WUCBA|nr:unnamed protein product [Wuchereria bancrofti]